MAFDSLRFLREHHVAFVTEGHKHCRPGWVQVVCPFCTGNPGWHLGHNRDEDYWHCFRCGFHSREKVIQELAHVTLVRAKAILTLYGGRPAARKPRTIRDAEIDIDTPAPVEVRLPTGTTPPSQQPPLMAEYLKGRGFDPDHLQLIWDLRYAGHLSEHPYQFRVIAPITWRGTPISFQARDVTKKAENKYLDCPMDRETMNHKRILYGWDQALHRSDGLDWCIVVEGITDAWRLGPGALATFGIQFNLGQVGLLRHFRRRYILYDIETQAQKQADKLMGLLSPFQGTTKRLRIPRELGAKDPGDLPQEVAADLVQQVREDRI